MIDDFQDYLNYINSIKNDISKTLYKFAVNEKHYDLDSPESLHDAWVEYINITEKSSGLRNDSRSSRIEIKLLGPQHDRFITLIYDNVLSLNLDTHNLLNKGWGDLISHRVRFSNTNSYPIHDLKCANGNISIGFELFSYKYDRIGADQ